MSVQETLSGKTFFITGFTGLVGKCLVWKLLKSVPDVGCIKVLVRGSKQFPSARDRLNSILSDLPFSDLDPEVTNKVTLVEGDLAQDYNQLNGLLADVSVVVHAAATVNFEETMGDAVEVNLAATSRLLNFCASLNPQLFLYVSTAYSHCDQEGYISEKIPCVDEDPDMIMEAFKWMTPEMGDALQPHLLKKKPNSYIYTKALTENYIQAKMPSLTFPVTIVRPTIVGAALHEPYPGFIDNYNALTGALAAYGYGLWRVSGFDSNIVFDCVPVDLCVNGMIATINHVLTGKSRDKLLVAHLSTSGANPARWNVLNDVQLVAREKYPFEKALRYPRVFILPNEFWERITVFIAQDSFAKLYDVVLCLSGNKFRVSRITTRIKRLLRSTMYFVRHSWKFEQTTFEQVHDNLTEEDKQEFPMLSSEINWHDYYLQYYAGVKTYLLKETIEPEEIARRTRNRQILLKFMFYVGEPLIIILIIAIFFYVPFYLCNVLNLI